jgi:hypothetical protein
MKRTTAAADVIRVRHLIKRDTVPVGAADKNFQRHSNAVLPPLIILQETLRRCSATVLR